MGQAFDRNGDVMGEAFAASMEEVAKKLKTAHPDAEELRIRRLRETPQAEMPRYRSHKIVHAFKIREVGQPSGEGQVIIPDDAGFSAFIVSPDYINKHKPVAGGYYVVYDDGYASFSPAKAFEDGYTRI